MARKPKKDAEHTEEVETKESVAAKVKAQDTENHGQSREKPEKEHEEKSAVESVREQLEGLEEDYNNLNDKYLRLAAEFDNYKKRMDREFQKRIQHANAELIRDTLPILDDMERALRSAEDAGSAEKVKEGLQLVYTNFRNMLERKGVTPIESIGEPFNPELHEAMMVQESGEYDSQTVIQEFERGYRMGEDVLRHAKVVVSK